MIVYPEEILRERIKALEEALREVLADDEALMDITWRKRAYAALGGQDQ